MAYINNGHGVDQNRPAVLMRAGLITPTKPTGRSVYGFTAEFVAPLTFPISVSFNLLADSSATTIILFVLPASLSGVTDVFWTALALRTPAGPVHFFLIAWLAVLLLALHFLRENNPKPFTEQYRTTRSSVPLQCPCCQAQFIRIIQYSSMED
jgi:hypothetical protein